MPKNSPRRLLEHIPWTHLRAVGRRRAQLSRLPPGEPPGQVRDHPDAPDSLVRLVAFGADAHLDVQLERASLVGEAGAEAGGQAELLAQFAQLAQFDQNNYPYQVRWVDVRGVTDAPVLQAIGERFELPALALEDVQNPVHRPKVEFYEDVAHVILTMPSGQQNAADQQTAFGQQIVEFEPVNIFVGTGFVLTFQAQTENIDYFETIRKRAANPRGAIRANGADYLAYALIDRVIDAGFPVLDGFAELYRQLEQEVVGAGGRSILMRIHAMNSQLLALHRAVWPQIDLLANLRRHAEKAAPPDARFFGESIAPYLKDCSDHAIQIAELARYYHEMGNQLLDFSVSLAGHRQNEITKVPDDHRHHFYPAHLHCRGLRDEFQPGNLTVEYARAQLALRLSGDPAGDGGDCVGPGLFFLAKGLDRLR